MIDRGQMISTLLIIPCSIRKSEAHTAEALFPVPCSLKQKALRLTVRNAAVVFW